MLDIKRIREDFDNVKKAVESRGQVDFGIDNVITLDKKRRELLAEGGQHLGGGTGGNGDGLAAVAALAQGDVEGYLGQQRYLVAQLGG